MKEKTRIALEAVRTISKSAPKEEVKKAEAKFFNWLTSSKKVRS